MLIGRNGVYSATLAGAHVLTDADVVIQRLNPDGATRTVTVMPQRIGKGFLIVNTGTVAASILSVVDKDAAAVITIAMGESALVAGTGSGLVGVQLNETGAEGGSISSISATYGVNGSSGSTLTTTIDAVNAGAGEGRTVIAADEQVNIDDGTMNLQFDGGAVTETGMVSLDLSPSGALTLRGGGVSQFGDDTGYLAFGGTGAASLSGVTTLDLDASGAASLESSGGAINVGADAVAQAVNIATGAAARVITVGNAASASLALEAGVGALTVNADAASTMTIGTSLTLSTPLVSLNSLGEAVAGSGITLASGSEIIGVSKVVSTPIAYNTADGNAFQVPASEVWLIEDMWFQTSVDWDGNGAFVVGDATDADGFLTLANASLDPTYDESGGVAGWPTGSRGLDSANRGVYLTTAVTLNKRMFRAVGPYNVVFDNTPGTSTAGSGTLYMRYTRIA